VAVIDGQLPAKIRECIAKADSVRGDL